MRKTYLNINCLLNFVTRKAILFSCARVIVLTIVIIFFCNKISWSQDLHYTQYNYSPLNLNPSYAGSSDADYRVVLNHRSQWKSVTVPYKTLSASFDMKALGVKTPQPNTGFGVIINSDKDGDSHLKTLNVAAAFSYFKAINDSAHLLAGGIQLGYTQKSFDLNDLYFDNQFTGDLFDPNAPTGEPVTNDKMSYLDIGLGISGQLFRNENLPLNIGFAMQHLNSPRNSFYSSGNVKIKPHFIINAGTSYRITDKMLVQPSVLYMQQNSLSQFDFSGQLKYEIDQQQSPVSNVYAGIGMRMKDAIVLNVGADFKNIFAGFSYDINTSGLKRASNGKGAIEFAVIYKVKTVRALPPSPPCIIY